MIIIMERTAELAHELAANTPEGGNNKYFVYIVESFNDGEHFEADSGEYYAIVEGNNK